MDTGEVRIHGSGILEEAKKLRPLGCSLFDPATDLKEPKPKDAAEVAMLGDECCPVSLPTYKGANIGGGTGNNDVWCVTSLTFKVAAASTAAAGVSWFSFDADVYWENGS